MTAGRIVRRETDTEEVTLQSRGELVLTTQEVTAANARVAALGGLTISSDGELTLSEGSYVAGTTLDVAGQRIVSSAGLSAGGVLTVSAEEAHLVGGTIIGDGVLVRVGSMDNAGRVTSHDNLEGIVTVNERAWADLSDGESSMLGGDDGGLLGGSGHEGATGDVVGAAQRAAGRLMDGGEGLLVEELGAASGDTQVVAQVVTHLAELQRLQVGTGDHARSERARGVIQQLVDQRVLPAEHDRHEALGIELELGEGVQLSEHVEAHQVCFVDDQQRGLLLGTDVGEVVANGGGQGDG